ncbi:MAG: radical SAM/SPASM domain-containing protein [Anaerolineae bacterium]
MELMEKVRARLRRYNRQMGLAARYITYSLRQTRPWTYPHRMYLESTNACNLRCIMCPTGRGEAKRKKGFMDWRLFTQIVDEMAPHVETTTLHIWGEPLLHPQLPDMIAYCRKRGLRAEISTNAVLLDEEMSRAILAAGPSAIYIGMDGFTKETYEKVRRQADFERTMANIRRFLELKVTGGYTEPFVNLQIIEMAPTKEEIDAFRRQWQVPGVDRVHIKAFDSWGNQIGEIAQLRADAPAVPTKRYPCPNLWYHAHIYWDGTLVSCDRDFDALNQLGNVGEGVMKAWNGPLMAELRRKHIAGTLDDVPACRNCVEWAWWKPSWFSAQGNAPLRQDAGES